MKKRWQRCVCPADGSSGVCGRNWSSLFFYTAGRGEKFQKEETEMLKAEREYLESGAPEKAGPYPEEQSESGKKEKREELQDRGYRNCRRRKNKRQRKNEKERRREKGKEKRQSSRIKNVEKNAGKAVRSGFRFCGNEYIKNSKIFQNAQAEMWKLPLSYDQKRQEFQKISGPYIR